MRGRIVSAVLTVILSLGVLILTPGTGFAAQPTRFENHAIFISCFDPLLTNGTDFAGVSAGTSEANGDSATLAYWRAPASPEADPPTLFSGEGATVEASATHIEATIPLFAGDPGLPAGSATLTADLAPDGEPFVGSSTHEGNILFRDRSVVQGLIVTTGTLTMPDGVTTFDLAGCPGSEAHFEIFGTNPDAFSQTIRALILACEIDTGEGFLFMFGSTEGPGFVDIFFDSAAGALVAQGPGEGTFTEQGIDWSVPMADEATGESAGDAIVQATFTPTGEEVSFEARGSTFRSKVRGDLFDVEGEVTIPTTPTATTVDLSSCVAVDLRDKTVRTSPSGPKPGGPAPPNDEPSGAITLLPGSKINTQTRGASADPEVPCTFETPDGPFELPMGYTLWYRITGTGQPVTVDSAGSDFDTILGVYTLEGGSFTQLSCVDDVPIEPFGVTLQSRTTFETVPGVTYFVQAGGFGGSEPSEPPSFGRLRLKVS